jgi:hypothetical protein
MKQGTFAIFWVPTSCVKYITIVKSAKTKSKNIFDYLLSQKSGSGEKPKYDVLNT